MFESVLTMGEGMATMQLAICMMAALLCGAVLATVYMYRSVYTKGFVLSLVVLPLAVQTVILLVNGNLGTGVAVAGAFSLVRFRSAPGSSKEITMIFCAMAAGLACGMGQVLFALLFTGVIGTLLLVLNTLPVAMGNHREKELKITISETLDYDSLFDDLFAKYTRVHQLVRVKTTNMGSLYELRDGTKEKAFLDDLRCRNGNLNISLGRTCARYEEL